MLVVDSSRKACQQDFLPNSAWLFKKSEIFRFFFLLQAVGSLTANYSEVLRIEPLEQSTVS